MKFQISIDAKKIIWVSATLMLSWISYISVTAIDNRSLVSRLEEKHSQDGRQDEELREIRKSLQQMTVLFFKEEGKTKDPLDYGDPSNPNTLSAVQMDLEAMLHRKGNK